jgi:hypothetical protein
VRGDEIADLNEERRELLRRPMLGRRGGFLLDDGGRARALRAFGRGDEAVQVGDPRRVDADAFGLRVRLCDARQERRKGGEEHVGARDGGVERLAAATGGGLGSGGRSSGRSGDGGHGRRF